MPVRQGLHFEIQQQLALTPQLRQAIRLLQLSSVELQTELSEAVESNPLLDREDGNHSEDATESDERAGKDSEVPDRAEETSEFPDSFDIQDSWDLDSGSPEWRTQSGKGGDGEDTLESSVAHVEDLYTFLHRQVDVTPLSDKDRTIAGVIIDSLDENGHLREDKSVLRKILGDSVTFEEIEAVRQRVMRYEPVGVASYDLKECLLVQLAELPAKTPHLILAMTLVKYHLADMTKDSGKLAQQLKVSATNLQHAIGLVRSLNPHPGQNYTTTKVDYIVPDVFAIKANNQWTVRLNPDCQPSVSINRHYERLAAQSRGDQGRYLKGCLQEARWLLRSLHARSETLLRVANVIVRHQTAFLAHGPEHMRPLTLREVAEELLIHESTVSRITTRKYMHTPRGTFELKHFFSVGLATDKGSDTSATAIRAMIRKMIDNENPAKPLSDSAIAVQLGQRGIQIARRTVAKYREAMNIAASNERSRLR